MTKKIIHVNRQHIAMNAKDGGDRAVYTIKTEGKTIYAREVIIEGPSKLVYNGKQLSCGARAWLETYAPCTYIGQTDFQGARHGSLSV